MKLTRGRSVWGSLGLLLLLLTTPAVAAEDRQAMEADLFSGSEDNTISAQAAVALALPTPEPSTTSFSGRITSASIMIDSNTIAAHSLFSFAVADIYLDVRLPRQAKVFASVEAIYLSQGQTTQVTLPELFMDFNLANQVYFRTGKQVLQWGRCVLWNPTDLINVEHPTFIRKIGEREGAYGAKAQVPFGAGFNLYGFLDTGSSPDLESIGGSLKVEYLLGPLELALSSWGRPGSLPVWGLDFSTRVLGLDTVGEVSLSQGDHQTRARLVNGTLTMDPPDPTWFPRASLDLSRSFTVGDIKDQLTVMVEGYYDRGGYAENVLADPTDYPYATPVFNGTTLVTHGTYQDYINANYLYQPNYFSRAYVALFTSFARFLITDLSLNVNYIVNLVDHSSLLSSGVTYLALNGFTAGLLLNAHYGGQDREYTFHGEKYDLQLTLGISF